MSFKMWSSGATAQDSWVNQPANSRHAVNNTVTRLRDGGPNNRGSIPRHSDGFFHYPKRFLTPFQ